MKILIVTCPTAPNFGSFLQAYSLLKILKENGHEVCFFQKESEKEVKKAFYRPRVLFTSLLKYGFKGFSRFVFLKKQYKIFQTAIHNNFLFSSSKEGFDLIILGSDEIWNVANGFIDPIFYGECRKNVLAFSVSCGSATIESFDDYSYLKECIQSIPIIYARDIHTKAMIQEISGKDCEVVLDPTLIIPTKEITYQRSKIIECPYLLIYSYCITKKMRTILVQFAKQNHVKIISIGFFYSWADMNINCSPLELYSYCKNASFIYTSTFHGTVFSILSGTKFISSPSAFANTKVKDLLTLTGTMQRCVPECSATLEDFSNAMMQPIETKKINCLIEDAREKSIQCLLEGICILENEKYS